MSNLSSNFFTNHFLDNKENNFFSARNLSILKFPFDVSAISFFCSIINKKIKQLNSKPYKLIILDCDNTLWGGILDENKNKELLYGNKGKGKFFKNFQLKIKELKTKGFLLSICSKNNEKKVWNFFKQRKMALQKRDFIFSKINWSEKYENILNIVKNLDLRFEDCVFIDDNILENKKIQNKIKKINLIHIKNIADANKILSTDERFDKILVSKEDRKKHNQYKLREKYFKFVSTKNDKNTNSNKVIKDLKQKVRIIDYSNLNSRRAEELFKKTNQFNFSLNRYKSHQLENFKKKSEYDLKMFNLKDKFGNHGIIGAYILKVEKDKILINDFLLSCRVLYRFVEEYILVKISTKYPNKELIIVHNKSFLNTNLIDKFLTKKIFKFLYKNKNNFFYKINFDKKILNETKKLFIN